MVHPRRTFAAHHVVVLAWLAGACGKPDSTAMTQAWEPDESSGTSDAEDGESEDTADPSSSPSSASEEPTPQPCDDTCDAPPSDCQLAPGVCEDGLCAYDDALAGTPCITDCAGGGYCDAGGQCICSASCADDCTAGPHQTAMCDDAGACVRTCEAPYEDCDADPSNGCEVPVGMPHQCDTSGLNPGGGCWTAYCGSMSGAGIFDFGTFHCIDCPTCGTTDGGQCHWCNHDTGNWFPAEACECGEFLDAACGG